MNEARKRKVEFGDFQTPLSLARTVCQRIQRLGIEPATIVEPTCGVGAFVHAACEEFPHAQVVGHELNADYLASLQASLVCQPYADRVRLVPSDFFSVNWREALDSVERRVLVLGNLPWVTSSVLGTLGSDNLPEKSNFQKHKGFDAISGKANFDISEWMLIALVEALAERGGDIAMLVKTATARKVIAYAERNGVGVSEASTTSIDAKQEFDASVDACLLVLRLTGARSLGGVDYDVFSSLLATEPKRVGHRHGFTVSDLARFEAQANLLGDPPQKWRSGVKHDASSIMELTRQGEHYVNGLGEIVDVEDTYLYPLLKGSSIGSDRGFLGKYVFVTQTRTGEDTAEIERVAPKTWAYFERHAGVLDARGSSIYTRGPRFSIFGIGDYAFRPWRVAICGLYKRLGFRLVGPMGNKPIMFDDTVYFVSFDAQAEAERAMGAITSPECLALYESLIFWDEKRPIKASVLNAVDWTRAI